MNDPIERGTQIHECVKSYAIEALNSLEASAWTLWCAQLFGRRLICRDAVGAVYLRKWRGKWYFMKAASFPDK